MSMVDILLKDKQQYLHAVYVLTLDALLQTHGCSYREFENMLEACLMDKIPSVGREVKNIICHSLQLNQKSNTFGTGFACLR